ncbi:hypothetical protein E2C01_076821 [Portunus trituberculatus]|uniref:Uncharacterized protein n=1 Tax=Portunus trituberculatus TaxID=210409 RepID=A0A5B7IIR6_PORTR|nr:hypothetical protein [Portunus trituberculatus]
MLHDIIQEDTIRQSSVGEAAAAITLKGAHLETEEGVSHESRLTPPPPAPITTTAATTTTHSPSLVSPLLALSSSSLTLLQCLLIICLCSTFSPLPPIH